jgi:uncharacterized protein (DUF427 family)
MRVGTRVTAVSYVTVRTRPRQEQEDDMSLTLGGGPLSGRTPADANYAVDGPAHKLFFQDFPRRVRAEFGGVTVLDSDRGRLLHETGLLPVLYVPIEDLRADLLEKTDHTTHCPFKGDAAYWSVRVGDGVAENAVWTYPEPVGGAEWLDGYAALYWGSMDAWYDEDEPIEGHLRDPYHRVDVRRTNRHATVTANTGGRALTLAETDRPVVLSETGLPNRIYVPADDVHFDLLERSETRTVCAYKGASAYWSLRDGDTTLTDVAWGYPEPYEDAAKLDGYVCFLHDDVAVDLGPRR